MFTDPPLMAGCNPPYEVSSRRPRAAYRRSFARARRAGTQQRRQRARI